MDGSIKEIFVRRIYSELADFKKSLIWQEKDTIFGESYKIEIFVNLYEILVELAPELPDEVLLQIIKRDGNILESLYLEWLKRDDSSYQELKEYVNSELEIEAVMELAG